MKPELIDNVIYPLTIIADRYTGVYSGGRFTAWNMYHYELPKEIEDEDSECMSFWQNKKHNDLKNEWGEQVIVGVGNSPQEAMLDLYIKIKNYETTTD